MQLPTASEFVCLARSGARSRHMAFQADLLLDRLKNDQLCDWNQDWKLITLFVGVSRTLARIASRFILN